ncbi:hypothetical protein F4778DRAFT_693094 [Xylariomycetidae sp. FL2044]|nr:hypothetical protein F4778DRAFT_693094 [Xylariomycetidae sp. FL2044]
MGSINKQISRYEATAVYTHPDAKVDIVLVHGLNGDPQKTWTAKNSVFWPADLLPTSLREARANILVYGYNADVYSKKHGSNPSDNFIYMHAQTLITSLTHYRKDEQTSSNPIIWVCHSLGGILTKRALLYSNDLRLSQHEDYRSIYVSTYGMIFLGTPHTGSDIASWGTVLQAMSDAVVPKSFFQSESVLLKTLKRDNETLQNINNHFLDIYQRFKILMAHENHKTDFKGTRMLVVDANSAGPQLPGVTYYSIEATHSGMCKFDSKNAPGYRTIATAIREWVLAAPDVIATRWRVEEDEKLARAKHEIEERMKPWINSQRISQSGHETIPSQNNETTLPSAQEPSRLENQNKHLLPEPETPNQQQGGEEFFPSQQSKSDDPESAPEPLFVKPTVFRPNTFFKGRDKELRQLHRMLMDRKRRSVGTSSVLIQSMPGGGKSHLARQYVFQHKYDYPGGIFWIRAKSLQEMEYGYWDIAKTVGLHEVRSLDHDGVNNSRKMVKAVQAWLSNNEDWLLVLDGIHFDFPDLPHFIPFAKNTSIIYTSTEKTTGEAYQFDNPQTLALDSLTKQEAQELLFEEMGKKKPYTQDDLKRAEELVELMDRLPLMIHVSALHLKATREPLAKYLRSYRSRPKVGNLPAYRAVREQLEYRGATAALNLMSMLAFFGTHIPVEMISLGAKALDKRTPVKSSEAGIRGSSGSLNNTFKVLIAFALLERNETHEASSASSQRTTHSVDMNQDTLDILRIHGIVQAFFVDVLAEEGEAAFWLERAICIFCSAFDTSDQKIKQDPQTGIPEDYRRFLIHGQRLSTHLDRFQRKSPELIISREQLDMRLDAIQDRIDQLNKRAANLAASRGTRDIVVSVFERTSSQSEGDSVTPRSNTSLIQHYMLDENTEPLESPAIYSPTDYNPYHWHVTYPHGAPWTTRDELDISRTVTPQAPPTEIFESMTMPDDDEITRKVFGPNHRTIKRHAEKRYRDHAGAWRASSQILSDPRVSISRETARGLISTSTVPQYAGPTASSAESKEATESEAHVTLSQIKKVAPVLQKAGNILADLGFGSSTSSGSSLSPNTRPKLMAGRTSYATAHTEEAPLDDHPITPTFSYPPPSSREAAAKIMGLKDIGNSGSRPNSVDGLAPVKISSPLSSGAVNTNSISAAHSPPKQTEHSPVMEGRTLEQIVKPPASSSRPPSRSPPLPPASSSRPPSRPGSTPLSLSARSSPSQATGPFRPPPIPFEVNTTSSLRSGSLTSSTSRYRNPVSSQMQMTMPGYPIGEGEKEEEEEEEEADDYHKHLARSVSVSNAPPAPSYLPYPHTVHIPPDDDYSYYGKVPPYHHHSHHYHHHHHPPSWVATATAPNLHAQGYSSQPMSRDPSHQSSHSQNSSSTRSLPPPPSHQTSAPVPATQNPAVSAHQQQHSSGHLPASSQIMLRPRSRRPSLTESAPSPQLRGIGIGSGSGGGDDDDGPVITSYRLYNDMRKRGRRMGSSGESGSGFLRRFRRNIRGKNGKRQETKSVEDVVSSGSNTGVGDAAPMAHKRAGSASSGGRLGFGRAGRRGSSPAVIGNFGIGGEDMLMARSGSGSGSGSGSASGGGFRLDDGTFVEFGGSPRPMDGSTMQSASNRRTAGRGSPGSRSQSRSQSPKFGAAVLSGSDSRRRGSSADEGFGVGLGIQQRRRGS